MCIFAFYKNRGFSGQNLVYFCHKREQIILQNLRFYTFYFIKWSSICILLGILAGASSSFFLYTLNLATEFRDSHLGLIFLLPIAGFFIGLLYHYYGKEANRGTNLILEEYQKPQKTIPFRVAILVYVGTLLTHLFGGSAGREGTAVQMNTAIADQFTRAFQLTLSERKTMLIIGISGGFAAVFGTPLTGAVFAIELLYFSGVGLSSVIPSVVTAYMAYFTVEFIQIPHTKYPTPELPEWQIQTLLWLILLGIVFGLTARLFAFCSHFFATQAKNFIKYPPFRPLVGGIIFAVAIYFTDATTYMGLGIPTILESFAIQQGLWVFLLKLLATTFILGTGFKGGEVTPLFFVGATLGSAMAMFVPLPLAFLAAVGFVAVFAGATHTPFACAIMGVELFGLESGIYMLIVCLIAYLCSGTRGIYSSQVVQGPKIRWSIFFGKGKS